MAQEQAPISCMQRIVNSMQDLVQYYDDMVITNNGRFIIMANAKIVYMSPGGPEPPANEPPANAQEFYLPEIKIEIGTIPGQQNERFDNVRVAINIECNARFNDYYAKYIVDNTGKFYRRANPNVVFANVVADANGNYDVKYADIIVEGLDNAYADDAYIINANKDFVTTLCLIASENW